VYNLPTEPSKIKERIRRYERAFAKELQEFDMISDGSGKRYLLGPLYLILNDVEGAYNSYEWFEKTFPDDVGEPLQYLCWAITLLRKDDINAASNKLIETMLKNLYLIPHMLDINPERLDIWHGSNYEDIEYLSYLPPIAMELCTEEELDWVSRQYNSEKFTAIRERYIDIQRQLKTEPRGPKRTELVERASKLENLDFDGLDL
jgi:hypothetical protein